MIDLNDVRARVHGLLGFEGQPLFLSVEDSVSGAEAMEQFTATPPAAFVTIAGETAAPSKHMGRHEQTVLATVSILWALAAERADEDRADPMEEAKRQVILGLAGWRAAGAMDAFNYSSFSVRFIGEGLMWGEALFRARYFLSIAP